MNARHYNSTFNIVVIIILMVVAVSKVVELCGFICYAECVD